MTRTLVNCVVAGLAGMCLGNVVADTAGFVPGLLSAIGGAYTCFRFLDFITGER